MRMGGEAAAPEGQGAGATQKESRKERERTEICHSLRSPSSLPGWNCKKRTRFPPLGNLVPDPSSLPSGLPSRSVFPCAVCPAWLQHVSAPQLRQLERAAAVSVEHFSALASLLLPPNALPPRPYSSPRLPSPEPLVAAPLEPRHARSRRVADQTRSRH